MNLGRIREKPKIQISLQDKIIGEWCKGWKLRLGLKQGNERTKQSLWFCSVKAFAFYPVSLNNCG